MAQGAGAHQQAERLQAESAQRLEMFEREGKQPLTSKSPAQPKAARKSVGLQDFDRSDSESDEETPQDGDGSPSADTSGLSGYLAADPERTDSSPDGTRFSPQPQIGREIPQARSVANTTPASSFASASFVSAQEMRSPLDSPPAALRRTASDQAASVAEMSFGSNTTFARESDVEVEVSTPPRLPGFLSRNLPCSV